MIVQKVSSAGAGPINLVLLPYAGGSAAIFRGWTAKLPAWIHPIALTLPGRASRYGEPVLHDWDSLLNRLTQELRPALDGPFALFGHSLGALIAFELAHVLQSRIGKAPIWLGVSGSMAPSRRRRERDWLNCPDDDMVEELRTLGGTPLEVLETPELLALVLPALRADFHLADAYVPARRPKLTAPMLVIGGTQDDAIVENPANLSAWCDETTGPGRIAMIEAGHFFINSHSDQVIGSIVADLEGLANMAGQAFA